MSHQVTAHINRSAVLESVDRKPKIQKNMVNNTISKALQEVNNLGSKTKTVLY